MKRMSRVGAAFVACDGNGNVAALVNAANGTVSARYEYGPFGELIRATGPMAKANPFRFSTKYQDDESGLLYYGYRYYNPSSGRWISRDPIEENGGRNLYALWHNNAIILTDAIGLADGPPWPGFPPPMGRAPTPFPLPLPEPPVTPYPPQGPGSPGTGSPAPLPPSGRIPSSGNSGGCSNPSSAAAGALGICANTCNAIVNSLEYRSAVKICKSQLGSQSPGEKCCVMAFCTHCGCITGRTTITRVLAYLDDKPCEQAQVEFETPGKVVKPSCKKGDFRPQYKTLIKLGGGYGD